MSDCCSAKAEPLSTNTAECPVSGTKGLTVDAQTVKAVLTNAGLRRITSAQYRFCADPKCDIVYFADDGTTYATRDVRVPVWQKEPAGARVVCYCFGENERDIRVEIANCGKSDAVERVKAHIKASRCACEVRNPRGNCCLGDVGAAVKRVSEVITLAEGSR